MLVPSGRLSSRFGSFAFGSIPTHPNTSPIGVSNIVENDGRVDKFLASPNPLKPIDPASLSWRWVIRAAGNRRSTALKRYLSEQGYTLAGPLVVDQPGDNDTLLTFPLQLPMGALRPKNR